MSELKVSKYSWEIKYSVVAQYMSIGSLNKVAKLSNIPLTTVTAWSKQSWWLEIEEDIKRQRAVELDGKLSTIVDKSLEVIQDRLENGETVLNNKTGQLMQKPVSLRDAVAAGNNLLARQQQVKKAAEETKVVKDTVKETLESLKLEFAKWAKQEKTKDAETIEYVEVVPPEEEE